MVLMVWIVLIVAVVNVEAGLNTLGGVAMNEWEMGPGWVPGSTSALDIGASDDGASLPDSNLDILSTLIGCKKNGKEKENK